MTYAPSTEPERYVCQDERSRLRLAVWEAKSSVCQRTRQMLGTNAKLSPYTSAGSAPMTHSE